MKLGWHHLLPEEGDRPIEQEWGDDGLADAGARRIIGHPLERNCS